MAFRFRQFSVEDDHSTMKTGTDAVLLGAWTDAGHCSDILDIGTGCGVIALMMAQRSHAAVTGIDIDVNSFHEADLNFRNGPWSARMKAVNCAFQDFAQDTGPVFDLIVTNPPFFSNSLRSPVSARNTARHDDQLDATDLLAGVARLLCPTGRFSLILPSDRAASFREEAVMHGLFPVRELIIRPKPLAPPKRIALEFIFMSGKEIISNEIIIRKGDGSYTDEYIELTRDFYLGH